MYTENDIYQAIRLPYGNEAFTMTVFLPREGKTLNDLLGSVTADNWHFEGETYEVDLKLPRFETDTDQSLKEAMMALGMPTAFDRDKAEFPYFCNSPGYIDMMKQVAKIKVNEEGTEAAAVTVIGEGATSIPLMATFHANRPFFYIISERSTNVIFFMGQFTGSTTTAIDASKLSNLKSEASDLYDLQGRKVSNSQIRKGLYISGGKKVVLMQE
jgi:serpin B